MVLQFMLKKSDPSLNLHVPQSDNFLHFLFLFLYLVSRLKDWKGKYLAKNDYLKGCLVVSTLGCGAGGPSF